MGFNSGFKGLINFINKIELKRATQNIIKEKIRKSTNVKEYTRRRSENIAACLNRPEHIIIFPRYSLFTWQDRLIVTDG